MIAFIDDHRDVYGVEPICKVLPIAPSTYHAHVARRADPEKLPRRAKRDEALKAQIRRVFEENFRVYGVRKVWRQLAREGIAVARCTVARLMRAMGLEGAVRGKPLRTPISDKAVPCPLDRVNRQFQAPRPNALWVSDFTYGATWSGFVYVAFVIDAYVRRIVGWRVSRTAHAGFVLDHLGARDGSAGRRGNLRHGFQPEKPAGHAVVGLTWSVHAACDFESFVLRALSSAKAASISACCYSRWAIWSAIWDEDRGKPCGSPFGFPSARVSLISDNVKPSAFAFTIIDNRARSQCV
jgi:hypothetical protein